MKRSDITEAEVIEACDAFHQHRDSRPPWKQLVDKGYPEKVVYAKMSQLVDKGVLDYGVSVRTAWVQR